MSVVYWSRYYHGACAGCTDQHIGVCRLYRPAHRCVPAVQTCTSVCAVCIGMHVVVCRNYRPAHRCVPHVHTCTSACVPCTELHIGVCRTQYRECSIFYVRPKPKTSKVNPRQVMKVYCGCERIDPLASNLGCRRWWTVRLHPRLLYSSPSPFSSNWI